MAIQFVKDRKPGSALRRHVVVQTGVSVVINTMLSVLFGLAVSHGRDAVPLAGIGGMAFDFFPQTFMITLATVTAVTLATRAGLRRGALEGSVSVEWRPRNAVLRGLLLAFLATALLAPTAGWVLAQTGVQALDLSRFLVLKAVYGVFLALLVAPLAALSAARAQP